MGFLNLVELGEFVNWRPRFLQRKKANGVAGFTHAHNNP